MPIPMEVEATRMIQQKLVSFVTNEAEEEVTKKVTHAAEKQQFYQFAKSMPLI